MSLENIMLIILEKRSINMTIVLKSCPKCSGDLYLHTDIDNFKSLKCMQCSREFNKDSFKTSIRDMSHAA